MKRLLSITACVVVPAIGMGACSDAPAPGDDDSTGSSTGSSLMQSGAGSTGTGHGGTATGQGGASAGNGTGSGAGAATVPVCLPSCVTAQDCDLGTAYLDADNYACEQGACVYQGCNDNSECESVGNYLCHQPAVGIPYCTPGCNTPDDCDVAGAGEGAYDGDNYQCESGACVYSGCNSDEECALLDGNYRCGGSGSIKYCQPVCATPSDCDLGQGAAYDADNYSCIDELCQYLGCHSDSECQSTNGSVCH